MAVAKSQQQTAPRRRASSIRPNPQRQFVPASLPVESTVYDQVRAALTNTLPGHRHLITPEILARPPFLFLHDIITGILESSGFGDGLFADIEMDAKQINDKVAKLDFLEKIISYVEICSVSYATISAS